jgi:hypothetical protein
LLAKLAFQIDITSKTYYRAAILGYIYCSAPRLPESFMKHTLLRLTLLSLLISLPFSANAAMDEAAAYSTVQTMLADGRSTPADIIAALKDDGRTLSEATVFAMVSGGEDNRVAFATAGVASATSLMEAQAVVDAVLATAGKTGPVADALGVAFTKYSASIQPPSTYTGGNIATGGGAVSPSS